MLYMRNKGIPWRSSGRICALITGNAGSIPGWGTKTSYAVGQPSSRSTITEPARITASEATCHGYGVAAL